MPYGRGLRCPHPLRFSFANSPAVETALACSFCAASLQRGVQGRLAIQSTNYISLVASEGDCSDGCEFPGAYVCPYYGGFSRFKNKEGFFAVCCRLHYRWILPRGLCCSQPNWVAGSHRTGAEGCNAANVAGHEGLPDHPPLTGSVSINPLGTQHMEEQR